MESPTAYQFSQFRLVPGRRQLLSGDAPVKLGGRAFDMLLALVERRDRTVSKGELMDLVWPKLVVEENNLQVQIVALRKLLGQQAIATVPGRGYRFTLPVEAAGGAQGAGPASDEGPAPSADDDGDIALRTNLPSRLPPLFGRAADIDAVQALLSEHSAVTITGPGGIGKTRVAQAAGIAALEAFADGVWWVELAPVSDPALVSASVAGILGLRLAGDRDPQQAALSVIGARRLLLILDNCEHLLDGVTAFAERFAATCTNARLLVTSQEPLKTSAEHVYRLGALALPADSGVAAARRSGAVELFVHRAQAADPRFGLGEKNAEAVIEICRRLDGIPLAIELAAARLSLLGLEGVRARLNERFNVLTGGARAVLRRHQTLRAALDWSHGLLAPGEKAVFRRLGVFAGSFTLESAQQVAGSGEIDVWEVLEHLGTLVDKSMVVAEGDPVPRYRLLETTRLFALEQLAQAGETEALLRRHAQALVDWLSPFLEDRQRGAADPAEVGRLAPELPNMRAAIDWADAAGEGELALRLAGVSWIVWSYGNAVYEGWRRLLPLRHHIVPGLPARVAADYWAAITALGTTAARAETLEAAQRQVELLRAMADEHRLYLALQRLAAISARRGDERAAGAAIAEAERIERPQWPARQRGLLRWSKYRWLTMQGRHEEALQCALRQAALLLEEGPHMADNYRQALGSSVAEAEIHLGRIEAAEARAREALAGLPAGEVGNGYIHDVLMVALTVQGRSDEAVAQGRLALADLRRLGDESRLLETLALNAALQGRHAEAATIAGYVDAELARTGEVRWPPAAQRRARLDALLAVALPRDEAVRLGEAGARLPIDRAFALAFGEAAAG